VRKLQVTRKTRRNQGASSPTCLSSVGRQIWHIFGIGGVPAVSVHSWIQKDEAHYDSSFRPFDCVNGTPVGRRGLGVDFLLMIFVIVPEFLIREDGWSGEGHPH
jgi:hypothetical protein